MKHRTQNQQPKMVTIPKKRYDKLVDILLSATIQLNNKVDSTSPVGHLLDYKQFHQYDHMVQIGSYIYQYTNPMRNKAGHYINAQAPIKHTYYQVVEQHDNQVMVQPWHAKHQK